MNTRKPFKIMFLCTGNSARSVIGEYLMKEHGGDRFESYSSGADPTGRVNPMTLTVLKKYFGIDATDARSKSWEEFENVDLDFVISVCGNAKDSCPFWPPNTIVAHWGSPDPADFDGSEEEKEKFFFQVAMQINRRIKRFTSLPFDELDKQRLQELTEEIGNQEVELKDETPVSENERDRS